MTFETKTSFLKPFEKTEHGQYLDPKCFFIFTMTYWLNDKKSIWKKTIFCFGVVNHSLSLIAKVPWLKYNIGASLIDNDYYQPKPLLKSGPEAYYQILLYSRPGPEASLAAFQPCLARNGLPTISKMIM